MFTWDFIGHLQSRKVRQLLPVRPLHPLGRQRLGARAARAVRHRPTREVLVEVNVAGEAGKSGIAPGGAPGFLERSPVTVVGLMTMPPLAPTPEESRPHFAALRELAERHGLARAVDGDQPGLPGRGRRRARRSCASARRYMPAKAHNRAQKRHNHGRESRRSCAKLLTPHMAFRDTWHRALVYFGLAEDDAYEEDARAVRGAGGRAPGHLPRAPQRPPAERPPAARRDRRHLRRRARRRPAHDIAAAGRRRAAQRARGRGRARPLRRPEELQRRPGRRRQVQGRDPGDPQPPGHGHRPRQADDRLLERADLRARRRHAADRRQGLPAHAAQRRGVRRGAGAAVEKGFFNQS